TLGFGEFDVLKVNGSSSHDTISIDNGDRDNLVISGGTDHDTITASFFTSAIEIFGGSSNDTITLDDFSAFSIVVVAGGIDHDTITVGGQGNGVSVTGGSDDDTIIVTGVREGITLDAGTGGDTIITVTGPGIKFLNNIDTVSVGAHTHADTFGFSLGTSGTSFTTITGAQTGDHVAVGNSAGIVLTDPNGLGSTLIQAPTTATTLASYINSLGALTNGDTHVGFNKDPTVNATFIVTETQSGQTGAVEIVGQAFDHNSIAGHFLTLA